MNETIITIKTTQCCQYKLNTKRLLCNCGTNKFGAKLYNEASRLTQLFDCLCMIMIHMLQ